MATLGPMVIVTTTHKSTKFSDQYWCGESAMLLQRKLQRAFPDMFIYHGVTLTIPAKIIICTETHIEVPTAWQGYEVVHRVVL